MMNKHMMNKHMMMMVFRISSIIFMVLTLIAAAYVIFAEANPALAIVPAIFSFVLSQLYFAEVKKGTGR